jgi:hypothetical protein
MQRRRRWGGLLAVLPGCPLASLAVQCLRLRPTRPAGGGGRPGGDGRPGGGGPIGAGRKGEEEEEEEEEEARAQLKTTPKAVVPGGWVVRSTFMSALEGR